MPEWAKGEVYDFAYPYSNYWAIRSINFGAISRIYVFLTGLPAGTSAQARFSRLEALQETAYALRHPSLTVNGASITFPTTLEPDWYLEYQGAGPAQVFDPNGFTQAEIEPEGPVPTLRRGDNQVTFSCDQGPDLGETVQATLITRGEPLR